MPQDSSTDHIIEQLPHNLDAEKSTLAACILSHEALDEIVTMLRASDFFRASHQAIFSTILDMNSRHIPIDQISLVDTLKSSQQLDAVGGSAYVLEIANNSYALTNWSNHSKIVKRNSILRQLIKASSDIKALAYSATDDLGEIVEQAEKTLFAVTQQRVSASFLKLGDLLDQAFQEIDTLSKKKNQIVGVPSGFLDLDRLFHGFKDGDLVILAARPGVGKTSFALNMALEAAKRGITVALFSLEMSAQQLCMRMICSESRVSLQDIRNGSFDWNKIISSISSLHNAKLYIDDTPGLTVLEARAKARRQLRDVPPGEGLIIIDYLQLMQPQTARRDGNRSVEVGEISRGLKILAKETHMPVIALSQLSRAVEHRKEKRPQLSDLRDSGSIEQDADIVMFIDRSMDEAEAESDGRPDYNTAEIIVAKHRNGPTKDVTLSFIHEYTRFENYADASDFGV